MFATCNDSSVVMAQEGHTLAVSEVGLIVCMTFSPRSAMPVEFDQAQRRILDDSHSFWHCRCWTIIMVHGGVCALGNHDMLSRFTWDLLYPRWQPSLGIPTVCDAFCSWTSMRRLDKPLPHVCPGAYTDMDQDSVKKLQTARCNLSFHVYISWL